MTHSDFDRAVDHLREHAAPAEHDRVARWARRLEFRSGPESHTFSACEAHRHLLDTGNVNCFFAVDRQPIAAVDPADEIECDFCREG